MIYNKKNFLINFLLILKKFLKKKYSSSTTKTPLQMTSNLDSIDNISKNKCIKTTSILKANRLDACVITFFVVNLVLDIYFIFQFNLFLLFLYFLN